MHTLYTLGYSGWTPAQLVATVEQLQAVLLDIRYHPTSRRPEWMLSALIDLLGRNYVHVPQLGNRNYNSDGPIQLAAPERVLPTVAALLTRQPIILMCACRDAENCHRSDAADYIAEHLGAAVIHLPPAPREPPRLAPGKIPALTLTQPWASLVAIGAKRIETRSWTTSYRGPLAIHAAKGLGELGGERGLATWCAHEPFRSALADAGITNSKALPRGAVVAVTELLDCVPTHNPAVAAAPGRPWFVGEDRAGQFYEVPPHPDSDEYAFGDYSADRYAWLLAEVRTLPDPILARGALGLWLWTPPTDL